MLFLKDMVFDDRSHAGRELAKKLSGYAGRTDVLLYALPRGGVVVGKEIAEVLKRPLDVIVTRKIGAPYNEEYAIGALAETGETVWNEAERKATDARKLQDIVDHEEQEAKRRITAYREGRALPSFEGKTVVVIDDGVATGLTMLAAVRAAQHQGAAKIVIAVPHGAKDSLRMLRGEGAEVVVLEEPHWYGAVGQFYRDFPQTSDEEVVQILKTHGEKSV